MPQTHAARQKKCCEKQLQKYGKEVTKKKNRNGGKKKEKQILSWFGKKTE